MNYDSEHYDNFWSTIISQLPKGGSYRFDQRIEGYKIMLDIIPNKAKVFDYACGLGMVSIMLNKKKDCKVFGCDWSKVAVDYVNSKTTKGNFKATDEIFGYDYDYLILSHYLEHLKEPKKFLKECFKKAKNVIIALPNNFRKIGEHVDMQWSNWDEFYNLFSEYEIERVDEGKYQGAKPAWQHPIFIFKEKTMHPSYREPKKEVKKTVEKKKVAKRGKKQVKTVTVEETVDILNKAENAES